MENIVKSFLITFAVFVLSAFPVCAQKGKIVKSLTKGTAQSASHLAPSVGTSTKILAETGVEASVATGVKTTPVSSQSVFQIPAELTPPPTILQRVVKKHKRLLIGTQVSLGVPLRAAVERAYRLGVPLRAPVERAYRLGAQPEKHIRKLPLLEAKSFLTPDLQELFVTAEQRALPSPRQPFAVRPQLIFRGLALAPENTAPAIRNILENGLRLKDVGHHAANHTSSLAAGINVKAATLAAKPVTNLTADPFAAADWAKRRAYENSTLVVVVVNSSARGEIIQFSWDIPAEEINSVIALLNVNGQKTWCKVEVAGEGFKITPFEVDFEFPAAK